MVKVFELVAYERLLNIMTSDQQCVHLDLNIEFNIQLF